MDFLGRIKNFILNSRPRVFLYFLFINLPFIILTFDTTNWSDDYQYVHLLSLKARFSPLFSFLLDPTGGHKEGGHFAPVYNLFNYLLGLVTLDPRFFHFVVVLCFILTSYFVFLIVERYFKDKALGLLAGTLFGINYYMGFKAITWSCFHSHATNTLTGVVSLYFLIRYLEEKRLSFFAACGGFFLLTILNYESGFVFLPVLGLTVIFYYFKQKVSLKQAGLILISICFLSALFPLGARFKTGQAVPLSYRFQYKHDLQNYVYLANELLVKSTGLTFLYNKGIVDPLKNDITLKETLKKIIKEGDLGAIKEIAPRSMVLLLVLGVVTAALAIFVFAVSRQRLRRETYLFVLIYLGLFAVFLFIFYRVDIANAVAVFSSVIIADLTLSLLRDRKKIVHQAGVVILGLYFLTTLGTAADRFEDCYRKSFFGLSRMAVRGTDKIYDEMNAKIGRFAGNKMILFVHDYQPYLHTVGFERIGNLVGLGDFLCYNAARFYGDVLKTGLVDKYRNRTLLEFAEYFSKNPGYQQITVSSKEEAERYLKDRQINLAATVVLYLSQDYQVTNLAATAF